LLPESLQIAPEIAFRRSANSTIGFPRQERCEAKDGKDLNQEFPFQNSTFVHDPDTKTDHWDSLISICEVKAIIQTCEQFRTANDRRHNVEAFDSVPSKSD
jgi:hypothetical protein